jgi:hypothetical protein
MIRVERAIRIAVPAATAWQVLGDFSLAELSAGICKRVEVEGAGVGAVRTMYIEDHLGGGHVKERLISLDVQDRYMTYRMVDSGPVPFGDYVGSIRVTPAGPDACVVVMTSSFVPVEIEEATARQISISNIETALENARRAALRRAGQTLT